MLEPRLDPDEIEYLKDFMGRMAPRGINMVEWGSGGSTVMFAPYFTKGRFVSIEHNMDWFVKVTGELNAFGAEGEEFLKNCIYCYAQPLVDIRFYGYGVPYEENPCFAARYINPKIEGVDIWDSDVYFVDGICRGAVLATIASMASLGRDPVIFVHDYFGAEERGPWYEWAANLYSDVEKVGSTLARLHL